MTTESDVSGTPIPRCKACGMGAGERCEDHDVEAPCGAHGIVSASDETGAPTWMPHSVERYLDEAVFVDTETSDQVVMVSALPDRSGRFSVTTQGLRNPEAIALLQAAIDRLKAGSTGPAEDSPILRIRSHKCGGAPLVGRECDCPPERIYVAVDLLLSGGAIVAVQQSQTAAGYDPEDFDWIADTLRVALRYVGVHDPERPKR